MRSLIALLLTIRALGGRDLLSLPCWPLDGVTAKVQINTSSDEWLTHTSTDKWIVGTKQEDFAIPIHFEADDLSQECHSYFWQNRYYNDNKYLGVDSCGRVHGKSHKRDAQAVKMISNGDVDNRFTLQVGDQYLSVTESPALEGCECEGCPPNMMRSTSDPGDATVISLHEQAVEMTNWAQNLSGKIPLGGGLIQCLSDQVVQLGVDVRSSECSASCPDGHEATLPHMVCLPRLGHYIGNDMASPVVTFTKRNDAVSTITVALDQPPRAFAEGIRPDFRIDIRPTWRDLDQNSNCHQAFQPSADKIDTPGAVGWVNPTGVEKQTSTPIPLLDPIHGWFSADSDAWLQKNFTVPANVSASLSVTLFHRSTTPDQSMSVEINTTTGNLASFNATRAEWCPSPVYHQGQPCQMEVALNVAGTPENEIKVRIGSSGGEWGFNNFHLAVAQKSANFRHDDFNQNGGVCILNQVVDEDDDDYTSRNGWVGVFTLADSTIHGESFSSIRIQYPRVTSAHTLEEYAVWASQFDEGFDETTTHFLSSLTLFDEETSTSPRPIASYKVGSIIWGWHNLTTANQTVDVRRAFLSTSDDYMDDTSQVGEDLLIIVKRSHSGSAHFSIQMGVECPEGCWVHVVSVTTPLPLYRRLTAGRELAAHVVSEAHEIVDDQRPALSAGSSFLMMEADAGNAVSPGDPELEVNNADNAASPGVRGIVLMSAMMLTQIWQ